MKNQLIDLRNAVVDEIEKMISTKGYVHEQVDDEDTLSDIAYSVLFKQLTQTYHPEEAEILTQEFFEEIEDDLLEYVYEKYNGISFRNVEHDEIISCYAIDDKSLLACIKHCLID